MNETQTPFAQLGLPEPILKALNDVGYESPSPIQSEVIPVMMQGKDLIGRAQTGTGKTAAFALPVLSRLDIKQQKPQALVLAPTRELVIQVAEAFQEYAAHMPGFHIVPIYGGQSYGIQLRQLNRASHVIVGSPGRVMDLMRKGKLDFSGLDTLVLDEADEMLRMGFVDDIEWILEQTPSEHQIALFSATMPDEIRRIARKHLEQPKEISIKVKTATAETIDQRYWLVTGYHKLDALTRILEAEDTDGVIIFVRTKVATVELTDKLLARGYSAAALNGDLAQNHREQTVQKFKNGKLDILVATDVAARGLDVDRIGHVINYDIPYDTEAYVHRIGRTGRAGREGKAILFVAPRERRMLRQIEKATGKPIDQMSLPSAQVINDQRIAKFNQEITETLSGADLDFFRELVENYRKEHDTTGVDIAAALAHLLQGDQPLLLEDKPMPPPPRERRERDRKPGKGKRFERGDRGPRGPRDDSVPSGMERYRIEVGRNDGVKPGNIVGAIANEAGLDGKHIGHVKIFDKFSLVDLPEGMPKEVFKDLKKARVVGKALHISKDKKT